MIGKKYFVGKKWLPVDLECCDLFELFSMLLLLSMGALPWLWPWPVFEFALLGRRSWEEWHSKGRWQEEKEEKRRGKRREEHAATTVRHHHSPRPPPPQASASPAPSQSQAPSPLVQRLLAADTTVAASRRHHAKNDSAVEAASRQPPTPPRIKKMLLSPRVTTGVSSIIWGSGCDPELFKIFRNQDSLGSGCDPELFKIHGFLGAQLAVAFVLVVRYLGFAVPSFGFGRVFRPPGGLVDPFWQIQTAEHFRTLLPHRCAGSKSCLSHTRRTLPWPVLSLEVHITVQ